MKRLYFQDKNRRFIFSILEKKLYILKYILNNCTTSKSMRMAALSEIQNISVKFTQVRNRCIYTNRSRAIYRKFKISRLILKEIALKGNLMGVKKASW